MSSSRITYDIDAEPLSSVLKEEHIETEFVEKLRSLKYSIRPDIRDRTALEQNFRQKFEALNRVNLTDGEFQRLLFDGEKLTDLMQPLRLNWKARRIAELALMDDLVPLLKNRAQGHEISGLSAYE